jgi:hypothetical protein
MITNLTGRRAADRGEAANVIAPVLRAAIPRKFSVTQGAPAMQGHAHFFCP